MPNGIWFFNNYNFKFILRIWREIMKNQVVLSFLLGVSVVSFVSLVSFTVVLMFLS